MVMATGWDASQHLSPLATVRAKAVRLGAAYWHLSKSLSGEAQGRWIFFGTPAF